MQQPKSNEAILPAGITEELVQGLKEKHGEVILAEIGEEPNVMSVVAVRPPKMAICEYEKWSESDPDKAKQIMVNAGLKSHVDQVYANDYLFMSVYAAVCELQPIRKGVIIDLPEDLSKLPEGITDEMVNKAIAAYGKQNVKLAKVATAEDEKADIQVLMNRPGRTAVSDYEKFSDSNPLKAKRKLINGTLLSHKELTEKNDWVFFSVFSAAVQLLKVDKANFTKL